MIEINASVRNVRHRILRVCQIRFFVQHLADTADTCHGHTDHDHNHGQHHQAHEKRHDIAEKTGEIACGQRTAHDELGSKPGYGDDAEVNCDHHGRVIERQKALCFHRKIVKHFGRSGEFFVFIIFTHECLDHADGGDVFLHAGVQVVVPLEYLAENLKSNHHNGSDDRYQEDYGDQEHKT